MTSTGLKRTDRTVHYVNPVFPEYFADPFVLRHDGVYYAVGTSFQQVGQFSVLTSPDLVRWTRVGSALETPSGYEEGSFWAPEIAFADGLFYMYYSVGKGDKGHHLRVAISARPEGPYHDHGRLTSEETLFAIDASPYRHVDGEWYLFYATDLPDGAKPGTAVVVDRLVNMTNLAGSPTVVVRASEEWQRFESNREIYGRVLDWHTLEGPCAVYRNGKVYCLYSGGNWQNESYGVDFVVADHPLGPYEAESSTTPRLLRTVPGEVIGPGHNSIVSGPGGETDYIVYHAWNSERTARLMRLDRLEWTEDGPTCDGPSVTQRQVT